MNNRFKRTVSIMTLMTAMMTIIHIIESNIFWSIGWLLLFMASFFYSMKIMEKQEFKWHNLLFHPVISDLTLMCASFYVVIAMKYPNSWAPFIIFIIAAAILEVMTHKLEKHFSQEDNNE